MVIKGGFFRFFSRLSVPLLPCQFDLSGRIALNLKEYFTFPAEWSFVLREDSLKFLEGNYPVILNHSILSKYVRFIIKDIRGQ